MIPKFYSFLILSLFLAEAGCKTAGKLYQKGDYDGAVTRGVKELQKKPGDAEKTRMLKKAYDYAIQDHETKIRAYHADNNELKWEWIYNEYAVMQNLYSAIRKSPVAYEFISPKDYTEDVALYREKAGDMRMTRGLRWMEMQEKPAAKNAYREFQAALQFKPGNMEIETRLQEAFDAASTRVIILPVDQFGFLFSTYNDELKNFHEDLIRYMQHNKPNEFVHFYSEWDARSGDIEPDQFLEMNFNNLNTGHIKENKSTREVMKDVVIKETVYKPDSVIKVYGKVKAIITTTVRTLNAEGFLHATIRDMNRRHLWDENVGGSYTWTSEFSSYTGDERALTEEDRRLVKRVPAVVPSKQEIVSTIKNNIYNDLICRLKDYYSRY